MRGRAWGVAAAWALAAAATLAAQQPAPQPAEAPAGRPSGEAVVVVGIGAVGLEQDEDTAALLDLEVRLRPRWWGIRPEAGLHVASDESAYLRAGFGRDFPFGERWVAHVGFGAGAYRKGDGKDLGKTLEFRSALDISYRLREGLRLGAAVAHLSNAGLSEDNPGVETLTVTLAWRPRRR